MSTNAISNLPANQQIGTASGSLKLNLGPVVLVKPSGQMIGYGYDSTPTAAEVGVQMLVAVAAATSGDTIHVHYDGTVDDSIGKDGVNWRFGPVTITYNGSNTKGLFDDTSGAMSFKVDGLANLVYSGSGTTASNRRAAVFVSNSSSDVRIACDSILQTSSRSDTVIGTGLGIAAVRQTGGTLYIKCNRISSTNNCGAWWDDGIGHIDSNEIFGAAAGIYCNVSDTYSSGFHWYINSNKVYSTTGQAALLYSGTGITTKPRIWLDVKQLLVTSDGNYNGNGYCAMFIQNDIVVYLIDNEKIDLSAGRTASQAVYIDTTAELHLDTQKLAYGGTGIQCCTDGDGDSRIYANVGQFEPGASAVTLFQGEGTTAVSYLSGQDINGGVGDCLTLNDGTLNITSGKLTSGEAKKDLKRVGGTINVGPAVIYDNSKTSGTITREKFFGKTLPASAYTITNASTDRALNVSADTTAQGLAVLGTLIADLQAAGILQ